MISIELETNGMLILLTSIVPEKMCLWNAALYIVFTYIASCEDVPLFNKSYKQRDVKWSYSSYEKYSTYMKLYRGVNRDDIKYEYRMQFWNKGYRSIIMPCF